MHYNEVYLLYASLPQTMFHLSSLTRIADPHHLLKCIYWDKPQASQSQHEVLLAQSCLTLCDPMDCSPPGSCVHGIFQARMLDWVAISFSRGSSQLKDWTWVSFIAGRLFTVWATTEAPMSTYQKVIFSFPSSKSVYSTLATLGSTQQVALNKYS